MFLTIAIDSILIGGVFFSLNEVVSFYDKAHTFLYQKILAPTF